MTNNDDRNRRAVPVEQLVNWAYAVQMVHHAQRGRSALTMKSASPLAAQSSIFSEVVQVDASRDQGQEAAPDAWRIHDLVMELGMLKVDCGQDLAAARYFVLPQYRGAEPPHGTGGDADKTARPWPTNGLLSIDLRALVMLHGSRASRPLTYAAPDCYYKPEDMVRHKNNSGAYRLGWFQHVTPVGILPGDVAQADAIYAAWHGALRQLSKGLADIPLTMFSVTDALPPPPINPG